MSQTPQFVDQQDENVDQPNGHQVSTGIDNGLAKVAIAGVVGAFVGTVAGALANEKTAQSINRTVKGVGDAIKGAASGVNRRVKGVGDAVKGAASGVNNTGKATKDVVKDTESSVNDIDKGAVDAVNSSLSDVKVSVEDAVNQVKESVEDAQLNGKHNGKPSDDQSIKLYEERLVADKKQVKIGEVVIAKHVETQTAYISVPLKKEQVVVEVTIPVDAGVSLASSEANFYEGEVVRMEAYEETADIQKLAFVREELRVRKQVEHDTVQVEDKIRREKLDLEIQGRNIIDNTKTL